MIMKPQKAVLLIGSPKGKKSASRALGDRLMAGLSGRGVASETHSLTRAVEAEDSAAAMLEAVEKADILVFAFPLYVDQLPAPVVWALDQIAERCKQSHSYPLPWLAAIVQSGFPETHQNLPALEIMRRYAELSGFRWAGGLAMGMGGAVSGQGSGNREGMLRHVFRGLDLAAAELSEDRPIPEEAVSLFGRRFIPRWLYFLMANFGWRQQARGHRKKAGRKIDLYARPYAR
jgi:NAD(P)H-dependent FMN reductase